MKDRFVRERTREQERLRIMRQAKTQSTAKYGLGGLRKEGYRAPKPITLPKTPWDEKRE